MSSKSSKTEATAGDGAPETVTVGRILRPHGVRGEVKVEVLSDVPGRFAPGSSLLLVRKGAAPVERTVERSRTMRGFVVLTLDGVADREGAEALRDGWLEVPRAAVPEAPEGAYYQYELVGCRCTNGDEELGIVVEVIEDGGGLLLIVEGGGRRVPIPFVSGFLRQVNVAERTIAFELPEGLIEACASRS
jgi:16S rRNA processing protein RimM